MSTRNEIARVTVDLPVEARKKLKSMAASHGKTIRELIVESVIQRLASLCDDEVACPYPNCGIPNEETIKALEEIESGKALKAENLEDLFTKIGI